jgi:hypothetical protein
MAILAKGGNEYVRIRFNVGPGCSDEMCMEIDCSGEFLGVNEETKKLWKDEYDLNVEKEVWSGKIGYTSNYGNGYNSNYNSNYDKTYVKNDKAYDWPDDKPLWPDSKADGKPEKKVEKRPKRGLGLALRSMRKSVFWPKMYGMLTWAMDLPLRLMLRLARKLQKLQKD